MNPLLTFIDNSINSGVSREVITTQLLSQGWTKLDIDNAFLSLGIAKPVTPVISVPAQPVSPVIPPVQTIQKKSSMKLMIAIIVIVLLVIGGSVYAYFTFNASSLTPKDIIRNSFNASLKVRSFSFMSTSTGEIKSQNSSFPLLSNFKFTTKGAIDFHTPQSPLFNADFSINADTNDATNTGSLLLGLSTLYLDKNSYLSLKDFNVSFSSSDPKAMQTQMFVGLANGFASSLKDKWIKFDMSNATNIATTTQTSLSDEDKQMIRDYFSGMSYITSISNVGVENINNVPTYHIKMTLQGDQKMADMLQKITSTNKAVADSAQTKDLYDFIKQKIDLDTWIGKTDFFIYKIVSSPVSVDDPQTKTEMSSSHEISFSDYNTPISISAPQNSVTLNVLLNSLFGGLTNSKPLVK